MTTTLEIERTLSGSGNLIILRSRKDNLYLIAAKSNGTIVVWNLETGNIEQTIRAHSTFLSALVSFIGQAPDFLINLLVVARFRKRDQD